MKRQWTTKQIVGLILCTGSLVFFQNCNQTGLMLSVDQSSNGSSSFSNPYQAAAKVVIENNCAGCHAAGAGNYTMDMTQSNWVASLVSQGLIVPGNPTGSLWMQAVTQGRMPLGGGKVSASDLNTVVQWIQAGGSPGSTASASASPSSSASALPSSSPSASSSSSPQPSSSAATLSPTYSSLNAHIFSPMCVTCHGPTNQNGVELDTYATVKTQVSTSNPASSPLYTMVNGNYMPPAGGPLTGAQKAAILQWIQNGALNN